MRKFNYGQLAIVVLFTLIGSASYSAEDEAAGANNRDGATSTASAIPASAASTTKSATDAARQEVSDGSYEELPTQLKKVVDNISSQAQLAAMGKPNIERIKELQSAAGYYARFQPVCTKTQSAASGWCREKTSPQLQDYLNQVNILLGSVGSANVNSACNSWGNIMKMGQTALTAYTASCSAARATCESACTTAKNNLERVIKFEPGELRCTLVNTESLSPCEDLNKAIDAFDKFKATLKIDNEPNDPQKKSLALKYVACTYTYTQMLASALLGINSAMKAFGEANKCDQASSGTAQSLAEKCAIAANATLPDCICYKNPRTAGCATGLSTVGENSAEKIGLGQTDKSNKLDSTGLGNLNTKTENDASNRNPSSSDGSGLPGAPTGGGNAGLGGGGGGSGSGSGGSGDPAKKGLDANILSGAGGGGGGGSWGGSYSSSGDNKYRSYLPGGANDPNKGISGQQQMWIKEVTGQGGKSNWDKVKDRYRDNNSSLLNN